MDKKKILIVEDEPEMRSLLVLELETEGYEVTQAEDGQAAMDMLFQTRPDLIISDVLMPKKDGNKLLKELRQSSFGKDIPFIILTARAAMRDYFEVMAVDAFFEKPFKIEDLIAKIKDLLETHGQEETPRAVKKESQDDILIAHEMAKERKGQDVSVEESRRGPAAPVQKKESPKFQDKDTNKKILLLENDMAAFGKLQEIFSSQGCRVQLVTTAGECMEEANRISPDIIILKDVFNKMDAEELAQNLKTIPGLRKTPIVIYKAIGKNIEELGPGGVRTNTFRLNVDGEEMIGKVMAFLK